MLKKPLRANQQDGFVFEAYAEASSKVENLKRIKKDMWGDPVRWIRVDDLHRRARNYREQARVRLLAFEDVDTELLTPQLLSKEDLDRLVEERARLVGEIFIRLYQIDLVSKAARKAMGA